MGHDTGRNRQRKLVTPVATGQTLDPGIGVRIDEATTGSRDLQLSAVCAGPQLIERVEQNGAPVVVKGTREDARDVDRAL
jgi:hypothetical protein